MWQVNFLLKNIYSQLMHYQHMRSIMPTQKHKLEICDNNRSQYCPKVIYNSVVITNCVCASGLPWVLVIVDGAFVASKCSLIENYLATTQKPLLRFNSQKIQKWSKIGMLPIVETTIVQAFQRYFLFIIWLKGKEIGHPVSFFLGDLLYRIWWS